MTEHVLTSFQQLLQYIADELVSRDLRGMRFLCTDVLCAAECEGATSALRLFSALQSRSLLGYDNTLILREMLTLVSRLDLVKVLGPSDEEDRSNFSPYRKFLHKICEDTTSKDLEKMKFICEPHVGVACLNQVTVTEDLFEMMERSAILGPNNMDLLLQLIQAIHRDDLCRQLMALQVEGISTQPMSYDNKLPSVPPVTNTNTCLLSHNVSASGDIRRVVPPMATSGTYDSTHCYKMDARPRGICLIINNQFFFREDEHCKLKDRHGTNKDCEKLKYIFSKLHFRVLVKDDQKSTEMVSLARKFGHDTDHSQFDCFICCILSHGDCGQIYGSDSKVVDVCDITSQFVTHSLADKPKLFFIQACQGRLFNSAYYLDSAAHDELETSTNEHDISTASSSGASVHLSTDADPWVTSLRRSIPTQTDFLLSYATIPGYVSYRSRNSGSWYVQELVKALDECAHSDHLLDILVKVNSAVSELTVCTNKGNFKQSPAPFVTLRKKIYFT